MAALGLILLSGGTASAAEKKTSRSFFTADSPEVAKKVIAKIKLEDSLRFGVLPPGVNARRTGPASFHADAMGGLMGSVDARFVVKAVRGGSQITEHIRARSLFPIFPTAAGPLHEAAIDIKSAYQRARVRAGVKRVRGPVRRHSSKR